MSSNRPRWAEDKLAYARLLRLRGLHGRRLKNVLLKMEFKEAHALSLLPDKPVPPRLYEGEGPVIDHAWVEGETCSSSFEELTPYERWVCYLLSQNDREAMHVELGTSDITYRRIIRDIRKKLSHGKEMACLVGLGENESASYLPHEEGSRGLV